MSARASGQSIRAHKPAHLASFQLRPLCRAVALLIATTGAAHAAGIVNLANIGTKMNAARNAAGGAIANLGVSPQQAVQASQPSIRNLARAAQGIAQQIAAQQAAAAAGTAASNVPNGLTPGGLQVAPGASADLNNPALWINANLPTQSVDANGHVDVDVKQNGQNAVVTWQTMNVGRQTTLNFDQSAGTQSNGANNWVVLNRVLDPSGKPSQILGNMTAQGSVYVINRNGILFGAGSQVNVHSLVASSLDLLNATDSIKVNDSADIVASNQLFLPTGGLAALEAGQSTSGSSAQPKPNEVLGLGNVVSVTAADLYQAPGDIAIAPGASITTHANGTASDGGFVLVAAPNVTNGGSITATDGQVILAAGVGVSLRPNANNPQVLLPELSGSVALGLGTGAADITPVGTLTNTGIVQTARGNIDLLGTNVLQNGVVGATTSVNTPGGITISTVDEFLSNRPDGTAYAGTSLATPDPNGGANFTRRAGQLVFGDGSVTTVMPDDDGQTATSSPGTTFTPGSIAMTAGSVWFQSGSLIEAPGSSVSVAALTPLSAHDATPAGDTAVQGRIFVDTGATIDVSGLANVELPVSDLLLTVPLIGQNELANSPLLRNGFLKGLTNVVVDSTLSGTNLDGTQWVGSPVLNLADAVNAMPRTIGQLLINGGAITLSGAQVMTATGSSLNLNGGFVHYDGGIVDTTRLIDSSGAVVPIGAANPLDTFIGIAGQFVDNHPRWHVTNTWNNPLLSGGVFESDFIVGGAAGTLNLFASDAMVLDGNISAQAFGGEKQVQGNAQPAGGTLNVGANPAAGSASLVGLTQGQVPTNTGQPDLIILQNSAPQLTDLAPGFSANTPLDAAALGALSSTDPNNVLATTVLPTATINNAGFSNVNVTEDQRTGTGLIVAAGSQLKVQPGGSIDFNVLHGPVSVLGDLIAPSGTISITAGGTITVGPDATLDAAGQWVNNDTQLAPGTAPGNSEFINGGSVTLATVDNSSAGVDTTGSIDLASGSVIDVSGGGQMQANGQLLMQNGIPEGLGGNLSLLTYTGAFGGDTGLAVALPTTQPTAGRIAMDGTIRSEGFAGGGTLTLQALGFQIGGDPAQAPAFYVSLPADFFAQQGFGKYALNAMYDATIAPNSTVVVTQHNLMPNVPALQLAATGADLGAGALTSSGTLDPFHRQPTGLDITAGGYLAWAPPSNSPFPKYAGVTGGVTLGEGASIVGDAGASIGLGSPAQVTVLGSIIAPGGSITLSGDSAQRGFALPGQENSKAFTSPSQSVWLGADARLDVSGVALTDPLAAPVRSGLQTFVPDTGKVLPGGTVTISDDSGFVVAQAGAVIDVSGSSATFDQLQANGQYLPQQIASNAGSILLGAASGLFFDGTLLAHAGGPQAAGGTLTILAQQGAVTNVPQPGGGTASAPGATGLIVQQSGNLVPAGLKPGDTISQNPTGVLQFSADRLTGSGIGTLVLDVDNVTTGVPLPATAPSLPVAFAGNVDLSVSSSLIIDSGQLIALPAGSTSIPALAAGVSSVGAPTVNLAAPYVALVGPTRTTSQTDMTPVEALADGTLNVNASFIDLVNQTQLNNFGAANFTSSGDIRLTSTSPSNATGSPNEVRPGELFTSGNLTFKAADLYPSTATPFIIDAAAPADPATGQPLPTTITFLANGASDVPLSAGGTLLVDATNIVQAGTVRAPSGSLIFGVGDPTDTATRTQFNNLPLAATQSVALANGSVTSVSNEGAVIPFGITVDGVEWQFNPVAGQNAAPDVTAPPSKFVSVNGSNVALNAGATIDLSGGGDLQAEEFVPGPGGTRDVLSQFTVNFASSAGGVAVPVNPGGGNVYAILPGRQSPVAAYDPMFAQTVQPATNSDGSPATTTKALGVGAAALGGAVGQSIYLSGVKGLADGYYTLLPGKYATLPGAFRVTVANASGPVTPGSSQTLADGTVVVAGYMGNALDGSRAATPTLFDVQSGSVWQQYSQYTLTSANSFFPPLAAAAGNVTPQLPMDGGQLVLAATNGLSLGAKLNAAPAAGGAPAEVDIASQDIQITGNGAAALPGYLQIDAGQLDALGAGSLLIGGTRTQTNSGNAIDPLANSVVVSNDASSPLSGPEVILVTRGTTGSSDPNAANGLRIDPGSVISAEGSFPASKDVPITIGQNADATTGATAASGDGALLSVSTGGPQVVTRVNTSGTGLLTVGADATLTGGAALTLDSSGNLTFDPAAKLAASTIAVDGSTITFTDQTGAAAAALPGFVAGPTQLAQLAAAQHVILRSAGATTFDGTLTVTFGNTVDLSAGSFNSNGGAVTINAPSIAFTNETGAAVPAGTAGSGTLSVNATEIDFGAGDKTVSGFGSATFNASGGIVGQGTGSFDFGALPVTLNAPVFLADTGSAQTVKTAGALNLNPLSGTALALAPIGGAWNFAGGTLNDNGATIEAPSGNVSLEATSGDLTIGAGSVVSSAGVAKQFFDQTEFAPAGSITLTADAGAIDLATGSILDFSGANGGGAAGSLTLSAPNGAVNLQSTLKGTAATGFAGGSFTLDSGSAADLDGLAHQLASSGVNNTISVQTKTGNLVLSAGNTLTAQNVSLTADGGAGGQDPNNGNIQISGTIDASGIAGGQIGLFGKSGVDVEGSLLASGSDLSQRGGTVQIDTNGTPGSNVTLNSTFGYENIAAANSGVIRVGGGAVIDVSGGTAGGLLGGTVSFRAPLLDNGDVNVTVAPGAQIKGSRETSLEAFAVWSTTDPGTGATHFDGIIDPAGQYDSSGHLLAGTFTDQKGNTFMYTPASGTTPASLSNDPGASPDQVAADLAADLQSDFFSPTNANTAHQVFYGYQSDGTTPGTLMGFIQNGLGTTPVFAGRFAGVANFQATPGVELDNPSSAINGGNISVLSNWNLGAGQPNNSGSVTPAFRYQGVIAPALTLRAASDVEMDASITDGFFQNQVATILGGQAPGGGGGSSGPTSTFDAAETMFEQLMALDSTPVVVNFANGTSALRSADDPNDKLIAPLAGQADAYYGNYLSYATAWGNDFAKWSAVVGGAAGVPVNGHIISITPSPTAPLLSNFSTYAAYLAAYTTYLGTLTRATVLAIGTPPPIELSSNAADYQAYITTYNTYLTKMASGTVESLPNANPKTAFPFFFDPAAPLGIPVAGVNIGNLPGNLPANVATANNPLPLAFAALAGGQSASYRVIAGADMSSANPLSLQPVSALSATGGGNVTLDGHRAFVDSNGLTLLEPTMLRTGTGSIDVAAGNDVSLLDPTAPGVIYTAGAPAAGSPAVGAPAAIVSATAGGSPLPDILVTPAVNPDSGGDITIHAQNDISGIENVIDTTGAVTGKPGTNISQFWWQWMELGPSPTVSTKNAATTLTQITQTSIDFGAFDQGVMSVGGNVSVSAGHDISDLAVSLPTTWYLSNHNTTVNTVGGGNLTVRAGGNILSGDYFVANGTGTISAGGRIGADFEAANDLARLEPVSTLLATQNGVLNVTARQGADIGGVFDPSYVQGSISSYQQYRDSQGYSPDSAVNIEATTGDIAFGTLSSTQLIGAREGNQTPLDESAVLPATIELTAFTGGITIASGGQLAPSPTGQLSLIADQSINLTSQNGSLVDFGMLDLDPSSMPSPLQPTASVPVLSSNSVTLTGALPSNSPLAHTSTPLHADDTEPVRVYSLTGSIVDGVLEPQGAGNAGFFDKLVNLVVDKPATIQAGNDILNLSFQGQNLRDADFTRIVAGRDIVDTPPAINVQTPPGLMLGGPGTFDLEAGRNIGPLTNAQDVFNQNHNLNGGTEGIQTVGNANNPNLPHQSADLEVLFGIAPGVADAAFISTYIDPASTVPGVPSTTPALIAFMQQYDAGQGVDTGLAQDEQNAIAKVGTLTAAEAWKQFQALPGYVQRLFETQVLFGVLKDVGDDFNNPSSPFAGQYARGFQAISTLFPASLGYTANDLSGGSNGANTLVQTGNLDIRSTTIQTQQGGNVAILGPGGDALVGSTLAPPEIVSGTRVISGPGTQGILTLEKGDVDIFTDQSLLLAQSRVFTEQGGNMTIWSSNGDINAGKGSKSSVDVPPPEFVCDVNHFCTVDARGEVSGAGIATLQTIPGVPPGDVDLLAPRGTVDAGDAGIRVSGNLNIAALHVANADNIQVQGTATGIPVGAAVNLGALTAASAAAAAVNDMAKDIVRTNAGGVPHRHWVITVQVEGFGGSGDDDDYRRRTKNRPQTDSYDPNSPVQVIGHGALSAEQLAHVDEAAR